MDTASFFARILPRAGNKVLAELVPFKDKNTGEMRDGWRYTTYQSFDAMAEAVAQFDAQRRTIYHACNAYGDWYLDEAKGKKRLRTQVNVLACRALYDDIDIGKEGCYADRKEAMAAVRDFTKATGMPAPLVVYSGNGIHLYWPLTDDITPEEWFTLSVLKRRATTHFGLKVDPACDLDSARVLRPVGSTNRKNGEAKPVEAKNDPAPTSPAKLSAILETYIDANDVPQAKISTKGKKEVKNAFGAALENDYPPSFAERIATHCNVVKWFQETGAPDEPIWHKCIGALKNCEDGEEKIHTWSSQYSGYDMAETQTKIDAWSHGPTTCDVMRSVASSHCEGCTHKVKSPIQLGLIEETVAPEVSRVVEQKPDIATRDLTTDELIKKIWPQHYSARGGVMSRAVADPQTGAIEMVTFCDTVFYPVELTKNEEGEWEVLVEYVALHGETRQFSILASDVSSAEKLSTALASHTVWIYGKGGSVLSREFMRQACLKLQFMGREVNIFDGFGWDDSSEGFVIGNTKITANGEERVRLSKQIKSAGMDHDFGVEGSRNEWVRLVNEIYNRPGAEAYQFAFLVSAASPLISLAGIQGFHGIPVAYTGKGGRGKTTACRMAASIWGKGEHFLHSANKAGSTVNALLARVAIARHLPWIMDEMTGQSKDDISDMLYAMSNGKQKDRLAANGQFVSGDKRWDMFSFITGNVDITELLATMDNQHVADAVSVRCFEVKMPDDYNETVFAGVDAKTLIDGQLQNNYGHIGRELIRFYMAKRGKMINNVMALRQKYNPNTADETRERFYVDLICFALVAGAAMRHLGLIQFDLKAIEKWAFGVVMQLRRSRRERVMTEDELIGQYLSSLHDKTIVTKNIADARSGHANEVTVNSPREVPQARHATAAKRFIVSVKSIKDWCKENDVAPATLRDLLDKHGYVLHVQGRDKNGTFNWRLSTGTNLALGTARCIELDYAKVFGMEADASKGSATVVQLGVAGGVAQESSETAETAVSA